MRRPLKKVQSLRPSRAADGTPYIPDILKIRKGDVASRSFEDSSGILWEVFEVRRTSATPGGVSRGLERGWLTFQSTVGKRRLAPFPAGWSDAEASELERLCATARVANPPR